jgi:Protein of unknown function (DUF3606)
MTEIKNQPKDATIINIDNDAELEWWAEYFQINKDKIKEAVIRVGTSVISVRRYLQK